MTAHTVERAALRAGTASVNLAIIQPVALKEVLRPHLTQSGHSVRQLRPDRPALGQSVIKSLSVVQAFRTDEPSLPFRPRRSGRPGQEVRNFDHRPCVLPAVSAQIAIQFMLAFARHGLVQRCVDIRDLSSGALLNFVERAVVEVGRDDRQHVFDRERSAHGRVIKMGLYPETAKCARMQPVPWFYVIKPRIWAPVRGGKNCPAAVGNGQVTMEHSQPDMVVHGAVLVLGFVVVPVWMAMGFADYLCHRATDIEHTAGTRESLLHLIQFGLMGLPLLAVLFLQVNAGVLVVLAVFVSLHHVVAYIDVRYANATRQVRPVEQMIHSFLEMLPVTGYLLLAATEFGQLQALFGMGGEHAYLSLHLRSPALPRWYLVSVILVALAANLGPYLEEFVRCVRAAGFAPPQA